MHDGRRQRLRERAPRATPRPRSTVRQLARLVDLPELREPPHLPLEVAARAARTRPAPGRDDVGRMDLDERVDEVEPEPPPRVRALEPGRQLARDHVPVEVAHHVERHAEHVRVLADGDDLREPLEARPRGSRSAAPPRAPCRAPTAAAAGAAAGAARTARRRARARKVKFEPPPSPMRVARDRSRAEAVRVEERLDAIRATISGGLSAMRAILGAARSRRRRPSASAMPALLRAGQPLAEQHVREQHRRHRVQRAEHRRRARAARGRSRSAKSAFADDVGEPDRGHRPERRARDADRRPRSRAAATRAAARASRRVRRRASTARRPRGCRARGSRRRARARAPRRPRARLPAPARGDAARRSSTDASTAPTSATAAPPSASADGRSPVAIAIVNGTTAPQATSGETTLIVPSESAR